MSQAPARIERAIETLLREALPHETFTVSEIARRVYGDVEVVSRSHTLAIRRALIKVCERNPDWRWGRSTRRNPNLGHGSEHVLYNRRGPSAQDYR